MAFFASVMAEVTRVYFSIMSLFTSFTFALMCFVMSAILFIMLLFFQQYDRYDDTLFQRFLGWMLSVTFWFGALALVGASLHFFFVG